MCGWVCACVHVCMCTHLHANLGACLYVSVSATRVCYRCVYRCVCVHVLHGLHVHAPSPSCRMSSCDPIYFLSESANTTNLYMYCYKSCLATYSGCVVHVCIVLCILHCPSVAMHSPPPLHTHYPSLPYACPTECPGTCCDTIYCLSQAASEERYYLTRQGPENEYVCMHHFVHTLCVHVCAK